MIDSKRSLLKYMLSTAVLATKCSGIHAQSTKDVNEPYSSSDEMNEWMSRWIEAPGAVSGSLHLGRFADPYYFTTKPIGWKPNIGQSPPAVDVPTGFVTDYASIPRIFWSILPPDGLYTYPAIIHDYLYWEQSISRSDSDLIFKHAMEDFKVSKTKINTIYTAVRVGGGFAWSDNAKKKNSGEKRVLKAFPNDPTTRWSEWRKDKLVFH